MNPQKQTLAAVLGGVLVVIGTVLYIARPSEQVLPPSSFRETTSSLTRELLTSRSWAFLHVAGDVISPRVQLDPSGAIRGIDYPNESRWGRDDGTLVFYHSSGVPSTRFNEMRRESGKIVLSGRLLRPGHQPVVIHVLKEL